MTAILAEPAVPSIVLMYHRVVDNPTDPWSLCVSPAHFAAQLSVLVERTSPVSLADLCRGRPRQTGEMLRVAVTFDDGYADNWLTAVPLLRQAKIPATVFVTTGAIGGHREFWWDELEALLLHPGSRPPSLKIRIAGKDHCWDLHGAARYSEDMWVMHRSWKTSVAAPGPRQALYLALWQRLHACTPEEQQGIMEALAVWAGEPRGVRPAYRALSSTELIALSATDDIDIGAHTVTHPLLPGLSRPAARWELEHSKKYLEGLLGRPITALAYPHGVSSDETIAIASDAGYGLGCTTEMTRVAAGTTLLQVPRFQVENWTGREFTQRLLAWQGHGPRVPLAGDA